MVIDSCYLKHLDNSLGLYHKSGQTFNGTAFEIKPDRTVEACLIQSGAIVGTYSPDFFAGYDCTHKVDFTEHFDQLVEKYYDPGATNEEPPIYNGKPFTGLAYRFYTESDGRLSARTEYLYVNGDELGCIKWREGRLTAAYFNGIPQRDPDLDDSWVSAEPWRSELGKGSMDLVSQHYTWEKLFGEHPFDGELAHAFLDKFSASDADSLKYHSLLHLFFQRNPENKLKRLSIIGGLKYWDDCVEEACYWPFKHVDELFSRWPADENQLEITGDTFDDVLWHRFVACNDLCKVRQLTFILTNITQASANSLLTLPELKKVRFRPEKGDEQQEQLIECLQRERPDWEVVLEYSFEKKGHHTLI